MAVDANINRASSNVNSLIRDIQTTTNLLTDRWTGGARDEFAKKMVDIVKNYDSLNRVSEDISNLSKIITFYDKVNEYDMIYKKSNALCKSYKSNMDYAYRNNDMSAYNKYKSLYNKEFQRMENAISAGRKFDDMAYTTYTRITR